MSPSSTNLETWNHKNMTNDHDIFHDASDDIDLNHLGVVDHVQVVGEGKVFIHLCVGSVKKCWIQIKNCSDTS